MKRYLKFAATIYLLTILISCNNGPTESEPQPGRRDYVWTVDTLNMPMNFIGAVWGSSPNDVWVVGAGGDSKDRLLHYDGAKWITYKNEPILCAGNTLFGFSANNIWMGGDNNGRIWHYDGTRWSENYRYIVEGSHNVSIYNIWGPQPNDVYACGIISYIVNGKDLWRGFVLHYDGYTWQEILKVNFNSQFISIRKKQNKVYIFALRTSTTVSDTIAFYELNGNQLKEIYSNFTDKIIFGNFSLIDKELYFLIGKDIYLFRGESFVKQFSVDLPNFWYYLFGRNSKDIFISMRDGLAHFNGTDIQYLIKYNSIANKIIGGEPAFFDREIFCGFYDNNSSRNMILHGKLND